MADTPEDKDRRRRLLREIWSLGEEMELHNKELTPEEIGDLGSMLGDRVAWHIDTAAQVEDQITGAKVRLKNLQKAIESLEKRSELHRKRVEDILGHQPYQTSSHAVKWVKSVSTEFSEEIESMVKAGVVPDNLKDVATIEVKQVVKIPKAACKKMIESGVELKGVTLQENWKLKID